MFVSAKTTEFKKMIFQHNTKAQHIFQIAQRTGNVKKKEDLQKIIVIEIFLKSRACFRKQKKNSKK